MPALPAPSTMSPPLAAGRLLAAGHAVAGGIWLAVLIAAAVALLALFVAGVVSVLRADRLPASTRAGWIVAMFVFPFLGPLAWFVFGRGAQQSAQRPAGA